MGLAVHVTKHSAQSAFAVITEHPKHCEFGFAYELLGACDAVPLVREMVASLDRTLAGHRIDVQRGTHKALDVTANLTAPER